MGEVFRAHDTRLRRDVAVKVLPAHVASDSDRIRRSEAHAKGITDRDIKPENLFVTDPPELSTLNSKLPLDRVIRHYLEKQSGERF